MRFAAAVDPYDRRHAGTPAAPIRLLGRRETFSEAALRTLPAAANAELVAYPSVPMLSMRYAAATSPRPVVQLENSVEGSVATTAGRLATGDPVVITVSCCCRSASLSWPAQARLLPSQDVTTIPHAEAQVRGWLRDASRRAVHPGASTADGARAVAAGEAEAAVAAPLAAEHYRLDVVAHDIHDVEGAVTRFVLVAPAGSPPPRADWR